MARQLAPELPRETAKSATDQAFGAAAQFGEDLGTLAYHARRHQPRPDKPDIWKDLGSTFAMAFIAWLDLSHLLTPAVRDAARRAYPPGAPSIKLGKTNAKSTVIEAVADQLGVYFRNVRYQDRRSPLDPDVARVIAEAKAAMPFGRGAAFDGLMKKETRAAVLRLVHNFESAIRPRQSTRHLLS